MSRSLNSEEREGIILEIVEDMEFWEYEYILEWSQNILLNSLHEMPDKTLLEMYDMLTKNETFH